MTTCRRPGPDPAAEADEDRVVFLFPGQGAQHVGMARGLYETEPVFAEHFDSCAAAFGQELGYDLRAEVFDGAGHTLERTDRAQPALFAVEYALAKLVESYGCIRLRWQATVSASTPPRPLPGVRPVDRGQGGLNACPPDARLRTRCDGRGAVEP